MTRLGLSELEACLFAFETVCPRPTAEQIETWCSALPQFADAIREHAKYVEPPAARGRAAMNLLTETEIAEARAEGRAVMAAARRMLAAQKERKQEL